MKPYTITITNLDTGETRALSLAAYSPLDAQTEALTGMFRLAGWRRATATCTDATEHGWAADYQRFLDGAGVAANGVAPFLDTIPGMGGMA